MEQITPRLGSLKQYSFITHSFCGSEIWTWLSWVIGARSLTRLQSRWWLGLQSSQDSNGTRYSKVTHVAISRPQAFTGSSENPFLATWAFPQSSSQQGSWLPSERTSERKRKSLRSVNIHWSYHAPHHP